MKRKLLLLMAMPCFLKAFTLINETNEALPVFVGYTQVTKKGPNFDQPLKTVAFKKIEPGKSWNVPAKVTSISDTKEPVVFHLRGTGAIVVAVFEPTSEDKKNIEAESLEEVKMPAYEKNSRLYKKFTEDDLTVAQANNPLTKLKIKPKIDNQLWIDVKKTEMHKKCSPAKEDCSASSPALGALSEDEMNATIEQRGRARTSTIVPGARQAEYKKTGDKPA